MSSDNIANKTINTTLWGFVDRIATGLTRFIVTVVLARLLLPSDYGLIAMMGIFIAISNAFIDCGFSNALIRKLDCSQIDLSTAFYFNVGVSLAVYAILFICAPFFAEFYETDLFTKLLRIFGITLIINSFSIVQRTILIKKLDFKSNAKITITTAILSGGIGIGCAYLGMEVWALVIQTISSSTISLILLTLRTRWSPSFIFSKESMKYLWNFGSKMLVTGIISTIYGNIYSLLIGKVYDSKSLGIFNKGQETAQLLPAMIQSVFSKNSLPIMSELQNDLPKLTKVYSEFVVLVSFITFPIVCLLFFLAEPFVMIVLSEKWSESIIFIQIFALTSLLIPANGINLNLLQALGRPDYTLKAEIIKKGIGLITVFAFLRSGTIVLAIISSCMNVLAYVVNLFYAKKLVNLPYVKQLRDLMPVFASTFMMSVICYLSTHFINNYYISSIVCIVSGGAAYFASTKYLFKINYYNRIFNVIKSKLK